MLKALRSHSRNQSTFPCSRFSKSKIWILYLSLSPLLPSSSSDCCMNLNLCLPECCFVNRPLLVPVSTFLRVVLWIYWLAEESSHRKIVMDTLQKSLIKFYKRLNHSFQLTPSSPDNKQILSIDNHILCTAFMADKCFTLLLSTYLLILRFIIQHALFWVRNMEDYTIKWKICNGRGIGVVRIWCREKNEKETEGQENEWKSAAGRCGGTGTTLGHVRALGLWKLPEVNRGDNSRRHMEPAETISCN